MKSTAKMMAVTSATRGSEHSGESGSHELRNMGRGYWPYMGSNYDVQDRFRDRRGREHYDNGRYAPRNAKRGTLTWDNTREPEDAHGDEEMHYSYPNRIGYEYNQPRSDMDEMESRRRRDRRGRFRSDMRDNETEDDAGMYYPGPHYPPPVYDAYNRPHLIGFSANNAESKNNLHMIRGGVANDSLTLNEEMAHDWMHNLQNEDGTTGPHWTMEQTDQVLKQKSLKCDPLEFWVAMNGVYSDYCGVAKKFNVNNIDFYATMARAFIDDKDSQPNRLARYYQYITKH